MKKNKDEVEEMTEEGMINLLLELSDTEYWTAIMKYFDERLSLTTNSIFDLDPFKDPTKVARIQGLRLGLSDLEQFVILEKKRREELRKEENEK